ncbi:4765_t:CDS:2, partial [Gigaspora rosea]
MHQVLRFSQLPEAYFATNCKKTTSPRQSKRSKPTREIHIPNKRDGRDHQVSERSQRRLPHTSSTSEAITEIEVQVPIVTTRDLVEVARELRKLYFFRHIPLGWIKIPKIILNPYENITETKLQLPKTIEDLKEIINQYPLYKEITPPIDKYEKIIKTTEVLKTYFNFEDLPQYMLRLPDLLKDEWKIFMMMTSKHITQESSSHPEKPVVHIIAMTETKLSQSMQSELTLSNPLYKIYTANCNRETAKKHTQ